MIIYGYCAQTDFLNFRSKTISWYGVQLILPDATAAAADEGEYVDDDDVECATDVELSSATGKRAADCLLDCGLRGFTGGGVFLLSPDV